MKFLYCLQVANALTTKQSCDDSCSVDKWPSEIDNLGLLFRNMPEQRKVVSLKTTGQIPSWVQGSFYRNGPAIYNWSHAKYNHMFDPSGILQRFQVSNGDVQYNSRYIESRNYLGNKAAQDIIYPEVGTYGEFNNVSHHSDGTPIKNELEVKRNRLQFNIDYGSTSNTLVTIIPFHGWMMSMTETSIAHLHDPITLEAVHELDLAKAPNKPRGLNVKTLSAHGVIDNNDGTWWNTGMGLDESDVVPKSGHFVLRSKHAVSDGGFGTLLTPEEIMASLEFSDLLPNEDSKDPKIRYFHMFGSTKNYIVLPFLSVSISPSKMLELMTNAKPLIDAFEYDDSIVAEYQLFSKENFKFTAKKYQTAPSFFAHLINAYESEITNEIVFDTTLATNCSIFNLFTFDHINATGGALEEFYKTIRPAGTPVSYRFPLDKDSGKVDTNKIFNSDPKWQAFEQGGVEFPVTDFVNKFGVEYDHFWACGFGSVMPDRLYHGQKSTKKRYVYRAEGYSPSEPAFIKNPSTQKEDDGVLLSLMSPISDRNLRPFMVCLNATTMTELGRAYTPEGVNIPIGFHGGFVSHPVPTVYDSSSQHSFLNTISLFAVFINILL